MNLKELGNTPFRLSTLRTIFPNISQISSKAQHLEASGNIIRLRRGLYVVEPQVSGVSINEFLLANHIYGPSYVTMQTALRYYGLIPEAVHNIISVTIGLAKQFTNRYGTFIYIHSPEEYFAIGITTFSVAGASFLIATPEKALCDLVVFTPHLNLRYETEVRKWLEDDVRFDMDELAHFNVETIRRCAAKGRKQQMLKQIIKIIEHERNI